MCFGSPVHMRQVDIHARRGVFNCSLPTSSVDIRAQVEREMEQCIRAEQLRRLLKG